MAGMNTSWLGPRIGAAVLTVILPALLACAQPQWVAPTPPPAPRARPQWVWVRTPEPAPPAQPGQPDQPGAALDTAWLIREFDAPADVSDGHLALGADNHAVAYLNGVEVLKSDDWSHVAWTPVQILPGKNLLAIRAKNDRGAPTAANPAGVIGVLEATCGAGPALVITTDGAWSGASWEWEGWPGRVAPDAIAPVVVIGPMDSPPWKLADNAFAPLRPCPLLRRSFTISGQPTKAIVRIIGLGHYQLTCNGRIVGDTLFNQAWSVYDKTLFWQEFDLAPLLKPGENVLGVALGNSFWCVEPANDGRRYTKTDSMPDYSNGYPHLLWLDAKVQTASGTLGLASDTAWKWLEGPVTYSNIYAGEDYDARLARRGWDAPGFDDRAWKPVEAAPAPAATLAALEGPGMKAYQVFRATEIKEVAPDISTYVFPQNCSALLRFTIDGPAGATVRFKPCEYMDATGRVKFTYTWGTGKDIWLDYTLRGGGPETHEPVFFYVGAQYVQVEGAVPEGRDNPRRLPVVKNLELVHVRAACTEAGTFTCSSDLQNSAHRIIDWSMRSNMAHFPTDCPHREKNSWLEQDWHMARALSYRYNVHDWYFKLCRDIRDGQIADGHIPTNTPNYLVGLPPHGFWNEAPEWGVAGVLVPWHVYEWYGDRRVLGESFESMKRFVDYLASQAKDGAITSNLGDWYDYGHGKGDGPSQWTPAQVSATAIWALGARTVADAAEVLGRTDDAAKYRAMYTQIRADFLRLFYDPVTKTVKNTGSCQAGHAVALCAGLVPEADRGAVLQAIVDDVEKRNWQQTVGEVLQVFFVRALAEGARGDMLHRVYAREERGGYGYMVKSGLTTLPESWDAKPGTGNSMNHFMLGHLVEWHFAYVAGIRQRPGDVGWKHILIAPVPGPASGVTSAEATFESPSGTISSRWEVSKGRFSIHVRIPRGADARIVLPNSTEKSVGPGVWELECEMPDIRTELPNIR